MRHNRLYPGIVLICIGTAFLLHSMGLLHFHWGNFLFLWPLFFIIGGVNLLLNHNREPWALALRVLVLVSCLGVLFFGNFDYHYNWRSWGFHHRYNNDNDKDDDNDNDEHISSTLSNSTYSEPWSPEIKTAQLNISGGATSYTLNDTTADLLNATTEEYNGRYNFDHHIADSTAYIDLKMKTDHIMVGNGKSNKAEIRLSNKPVWDINIKGGADELKFNLSRFKIRNLKLSGGATDYTINMGMPLAVTNVNIEAGVSDITINVPKDAACQVTTSTGLSSNNIDGFSKVGDNHYETSNFNSAANKLYIHFSGGISDFKVNRN